MLRQVLILMVAVAAAFVAAPPAFGQDAEFFTKEGPAKLIAVLKSDAPLQQKYDACRQLGVLGTKEAVPVLAGLLGDEKLSHMARYALEPIPDPSVDAALRDALKKVKGRLLIGVINSIGVRRDAQAVGALTGLLKDADAAVAAAAAAALGRVATSEAVAALADFRAHAPGPLQAAATDASLAAAERLLAGGKADDAAAIYESIQAKECPRHVRAAVFAGLLDARPDQAGDRVVQVLTGDDPMLRALAITRIPGLKGQNVAARFAGELPKLPPAVQVLLIGALSDRGDPAAREAILKAGDSDDEEVRVSAVQAAGRLGDASTVPWLIARVTGGKSGTEKDAAVTSLTTLQAAGAGEAICGAMEASPETARPELIRILGARGEVSATGAMLKQAAQPDAKVRQAAFSALGVLAGPAEVPALLELLVNLPDDSARSQAEKAVVLASRKIADESRQADAVLAVLAKETRPPVRCSLLRVLGGVGGAKALAAIQAAAKDADEKVRDVAVREMFDWPDASAAPAVLDILRGATSEVYRALALRGYVRMAALPSDRPAEETMKMFSEAVQHAPRPEDKKAVLGGLANVAHPEALTLARQWLADPEVQAEAAMAAVRIGGAIAEKHREVVIETMREVVKTVKDANIKRDANRLLKQIDPDAGKTPASKTPASKKPVAKTPVSKAPAPQVRPVSTAEAREYIVAWQVCGPYRKEGGSDKELFNEPFPPEGGGAGAIAWRSLPAVGEEDAPLILRLDRTVGGTHCAAYVRTWVHSDSRQPARLEMGVDDAIKAWVNGKLVHENNSSGAAYPGEEKANVELQEGWNVLLLKVVQQTGPWSFCARLAGPDGQTLPGLSVDAAREPAGPAGPVLAAEPAAGSRAKKAPAKGKAAKDSAAKPGKGTEAATQTQPAEKPPLPPYVPQGDWKPLFNGKDLTGWTQEGNGVYGVEDGCLMGTQTDGKGGDLWVEGEYDDFELQATYRVVWPANTGIWFRHDGKKGYQFDILKWPKPVAFSGTLYCPGKLFLFINLKEDMENRDGWNEARIVARSDEITFWLNGTQTGTVRDETLRKGKFGIQVHGGEQFKGMKVYIKKIEVRKLVPAEGGATQPAAATPAATSQSAPAPVSFKTRRIGTYRSECCAVADFNRDGRPDILAGVYWYEAPNWTPHEFRRIEGKVSVDDKGMGYCDDFMNGALDVDGDGWTDLVTCAWFAKEIRWHRNPGAAGGAWTSEVVESGNFNYEHGQMADLEGGGKEQKILPYTKHTAWFEAVPGADGKGKFLRHEVCPKGRPFGAGAGDVNGDGRPDILRPDAWFEAPADIRGGKWVEHPLALGVLGEAKADHTAQILVHDVDGDGLNDIVTSNAHKYGIFWYQQVRKGGETSWTQHVIDKSWTQAHSLALADLDGDGDLDLVAGKRFMAHNGKDPGEFEPLGVYWYELKRGPQPQWIKHVITYNEGIGSGLNLVAADLDGDGDLDIVVTGKWGGPVLFENLLKSPEK